MLGVFVERVGESGQRHVERAVPGYNLLLGRQPDLRQL